MDGYKIFIVEDDPWYGEILEYHLSLNNDYGVSLFESGKACLKELHQQPDLITIDYSLGDMNGEELFQKIRQWNPNVPVIVISGQQEIDVALDLLKSGVLDYIIKDDNTKELLWNSVLKAQETAQLKQQVRNLTQQLGDKFDFKKSIIGNSRVMKNTFKLMTKAIGSHINVSISGETGTGKEIVAKAIHFNSDRKKKTFVPVNMASIPSELVESELFGHEKGSFTGAIARKIGKFEEAQGGSIFLDEIAELDIAAQSKLLRVLQEREITRVGGSGTVQLDVRVIAATHKNLQEEVQKGNFREDLYYRVIGLPIDLPPLREREEDVLLLAKYFLDAFCKESKSTVIKISAEAKKKLMSYNYPGNIRELKSMIELAAVMSDGKTIESNDINYGSARGDMAFMAIEKSMREYNCDIIKYFLKKYDNDVLMVGDKLSIGKSTIYKMIKDKEIEI